MSDTISRLYKIRHRHHLYNRLLTVGLVLFVCLIGWVFSLLGSILTGRSKMFTGLGIIFLAAVFYKIPYFAYRLNYRWFKGDKENLQLMEGGWKQYKLRILNFDNPT